MAVGYNKDMINAVLNMRLEAARELRAAQSTGNLLTKRVTKKVEVPNLPNKNKVLFSSIPESPISNTKKTNDPVADAPSSNTLESEYVCKRSKLLLERVILERAVKRVERKSTRLNKVASCQSIWMPDDPDR